MISRIPAHRGRPAGALLVLLALLALGPQSRAQDLIYTARTFGTSDLVVLAGGIEHPLVISDDLAEYDPSPSPDGEAIAYAATTYLDGVTAFGDGWRWQYRAVDRTGRELGRWDLPGSADRFRPAGGFELEWLPDGRSFLAQAFGDDLVWRVRRYFLGTERTVDLGAGFGILLDPAGSRFAITRDDGSFVVRIADGSEVHLGAGRALGWTPDGSGLLIERNFALLLVPLAAPTETRLVGDSGPYIELRWSPDRRHYAYTIALDEHSAVFFHDHDHRFLGSHPLGGFATSFDWLDDERIVIETAVAEGFGLLTLDLSGRVEELVTPSGGGGVRRLPR